MRLAALTLIALTVIASGCGGSKGAASTTANVTATASTTAAQPAPPVLTATGKALTAARLRAQADAICAQLNTELDKDRFGTLKRAARIAPHRAAIEMAALSELGRLAPLPKLVSGYEKMLELRRTLAEDTSRIGANYTNRPLVAQILTRSKLLVHELALVALHNGFKACGLLG